MRPAAPRRMLSIAIGLVHRRPERPPQSSATLSASRLAWETWWSRSSRPPNTGPSACRFSRSRRSASIRVLPACIRAAAAAAADMAAAARCRASSRSRATASSSRRNVASAGCVTSASTVAAGTPARSRWATAGRVRSASSAACWSRPSAASAAAAARRRHQRAVSAQ